MEENTIVLDFSNDAYTERYELALERVLEFPGSVTGAAGEYFSVLAALLKLCTVEKDSMSKKELNARLYSDLQEDAYAQSFLNPDHAVEMLGSCGTLLSAWYAEFRGIIPFSFENRIQDVTVLLETTIQIFNLYEERESCGLKENAVFTELSDIIYSYLYDYTEEFVEDYIARSTDPRYSFAKDIVMLADLGNTGEDSYLYDYGEWITKEELGVAKQLASLEEAVVEKMASTYTTGYIKGFEMTGKDIKKKSIVQCYMPLGFERFMRAAIRQFDAAGLDVVIVRNPVHLINKKNTANVKPGFYGASNAEYAYDHKEDLALFWGDKLKARKLQALKNAYETSRECLQQFSGHACVEIFGAKGSAPLAKKNNASFTRHQLDLNKEYAFKAHEIAQEFMPDEETSFTIIAWPTPSIAGDRADFESAKAFEEKYGELFDRFVEINTVPTDKWEKIQQCLIDALDRADYVEVKGAAGNATDIRVQLHKLMEPAKQTNFENCLADVNIPAGEVFTSPMLHGTNGTIHAGYVYIGGYLFRDLKISFTEGRVSDYSCANFENAEDGRELIRKIIFKNREELPLGEFAIGTNTAAYAAAGKYGIEAKMPVLIAEKTGPHFAVGDTCYSFEEDMVTFNPDGKQITARENECSALRSTEPEKAYFSVHTDVTLPYNELKSLAAVNAQETIMIIENGRFVLPGTEELNDAFEE